MATINVLLNLRRADKDGKYPIIIRALNGKDKKDIGTGYKILPTQWKDGKVVKHPDALVMNAGIEARRAELTRKLYELGIGGRRLRLELIDKPVTSHSFIDYLNHRAADYLARQKRTMEIKTKRFAKELGMCFGSVHFEDIDMDWIRKLDTWLIGQKNTVNTRHKKFEFYSSFYSAAIDEGKADGPNPFKKFKINKVPVKKEKLNLEELKRMEALPLADGAIKTARDLFLLSFYAKGLRFENCVTIKPADIRDGRIYWTGNKSGKHLSVEIHPKLQSIIDRLDLPYVVPDGDLWKQKKQIESFNVVVNRNLKHVAALAEIPFNLTFHISRHSFAYQLKTKSNNIHVISEALGHSDQRTTMIYLKALDDHAIDGDVAKVYDY